MRGSETLGSVIRALRASVGGTHDASNVWSGLPVHASDLESLSSLSSGSL